MSLTPRFAALAVAFVSVSAFGASNDELLSKQFISSAFKLSYDFEKEMTDVIVVNALVTNTTRISRSANRIIAIFEGTPDPDARPAALDDEFAALKITADTASLKLFRERTHGDRYRLDSTMPLARFRQLKWMNGELTNSVPFLKAVVSAPPAEGSTQWTKYALQPGHDHVAVKVGDKPLVFHEGFFINLYGLPAPMRFNMIVQVAALPSLEAIRGIQRHPGDAAYFRRHRIDPRKLESMVQAGSKKGYWASQHVSDGLAMFSFVSPDGVDHGMLRVLSDSRDLNRRHLAYARDPDGGKINSLFAWEYDAAGKPVRFLKVARSNDQKRLEAWVQYIVKAGTTTNVNNGLFDIDPSTFNSVYDKRLKNPTHTINGEVVMVLSDAESGKAVDPVRFARFVILFWGLLPLVVYSMYRRRKTN